MKTPYIGSVLLLGLGLAMLGCSAEERPDGMPDLQAVKIKVVQGGTALEGASVQLIPQDASNTWVSGGSTDAAGEAKIMTMGKYNGVPAGTYKVTIDKVVSDADANAVPDPSDSSEPASYRVVDPKYSLASTTPVELIVADSGATEETINVGAAVKEKQPEL